MTLTVQFGYFAAASLLRGQNLGAILRLFIARVALNIPNKGEVAVRYYGLYPNAH